MVKYVVLKCEDYTNPVLVDVVETENTEGIYEDYDDTPYFNTLLIITLEQAKGLLESLKGCLK